MKIVYIPNPQWIIHKDIVEHLEANIIKGQDNLITTFKEQGYCYSTWNTGAQIPGSQIYYAMVMEFEDEIRFTVEVIFKGTQMMKSYSQQIQMREGYDKPVKELLGFTRMKGIIKEKITSQMSIMQRLKEIENLPLTSLEKINKQREVLGFAPLTEEQVYGSKFPEDKSTKHQEG